ncbi:hypothetical protein GGR57DRAFT_242087 [Xylariaceae sp. FL1272]|nr:hypothetical protein GGR57DRAFT_242087 [Xylariaceae sp. FL1272]
MSGGGWKGIVKNGWHPETGDGSIKGQVKGLLGRGDSSSSSREDHVAMPISSLRDPSSFGPPPKHVGAYGNMTRNTSPTRSTPTPSSYAPAPAANYAQSPSSSTQSPTSITGQQQHYQQAQPVEEEKPEPRPYRTDTSGLSTAHLPPPPMRRDGADGRVPQPQAQAPPAYPTTAAPLAKKPPPSLPPRLPPRSTGSTPSPTRPTAHADTARGQVNQGAVDRLGAAGISVPGFGIGTSKAPSPVKSSAAPAPAPGQVNELQARFSRLGTSTAQTPPSVTGKQKPPPPPASKKPPVPGLGGGSDAPPPVPLASKPRF